VPVQTEDSRSNAVRCLHLAPGAIPTSLLQHAPFSIHNLAFSIPFVASSLSECDDTHYAITGISALKRVYGICQFPWGMMVCIFIDFLTISRACSRLLICPRASA
jgi:hypothetical protein